MREPVVLKGPGSTPEQYAKEMGISPERQAMLREIIANVERKSARRGKSNHKPGVKPNKKTVPQTCPA